MDNKEFKELFNEMAKRYHFEKAFGGWFAESNECIIALDLQKSNFRDSYYLNIKIYVQGLFGNSYKKSKDLVKRDVGNIFRRSPKEYEDVFDLEIESDDERRQERLENLFTEFINPFVDQALSKVGIKKLEEQGVVFLLPAVKEQWSFINPAVKQ